MPCHLLHYLLGTGSIDESRKGSRSLVQFSLTSRKIMKQLVHQSKKVQRTTGTLRLFSTWKVIRIPLHLENSKWCFSKVGTDNQRAINFSAIKQDSTRTHYGLLKLSKAIAAFSQSPRRTCCSLGGGDQLAYMKRQTIHSFSSLGGKTGIYTTALLKKYIVMGGGNNKGSFWLIWTTYALHVQSILHTYIHIQRFSSCVG